MPRVAVAERNACLSSINTDLANGWIRIYDGTRPTNADTAPTGNTVLAELRFAATAFATPSAGSMSANAITGDTQANAPGTASWARLFRTDGTTAVMDISVGTSGAELNLVTTTIALNQPVNISSFTLSWPVGT